MARNVADVALLFEAMRAIDPRDPLSHPPHPADPRALEPADLCSLKVAISEDLGFSPLDHGIRDTFRAAVARFADVFASAEQADPPLDGADYVFDVTRAANFLAGHADSYRNRRDMLGPNIVANVEQGLGMSLEDAARAGRMHTALYRRFLDFMAGYDVLICPAMSVPPFPHSQLHPTHINGDELRTYFHWLAPAYGLTLTGSPVVCLPCGLDHTGMPFGIQVCGRRFGDWRVLGIAAALERHLQDIPELARPLPDLEALAG
jgi:Asp-tRNA(Asn)/Glu-tRNA(Gln) amidotransferase A subunit family amidase